MDELDVEYARYSWIKDCVPVVTLAFEVGWKTVNLKIHKLVPYVRNLVARHAKSVVLSRRRRRTWNCWRVRKWVGAIELRRSWAARVRTNVGTRLARSW